MAIQILKKTAQISTSTLNSQDTSKSSKLKRLTKVFQRKDDSTTSLKPKLQKISKAGRSKKSLLVDLSVQNYGHPDPNDKVKQTIQNTGFANLQTPGRVLRPRSGRRVEVMSAISVLPVTGFTGTYGHIKSPNFDEDKQEVGLSNTFDSDHPDPNDKVKQNIQNLAYARIQTPGRVLRPRTRSSIQVMSAISVIPVSGFKESFAHMSSPNFDEDLEMAAMEKATPVLPPRSNRKRGLKIRTEPVEPRFVFVQEATPVNAFKRNGTTRRARRF